MAIPPRPPEGSGAHTNFRWSQKTKSRKTSTHRTANKTQKEESAIPVNQVPRVSGPAKKE